MISWTEAYLLYFIMIDILCYALWSMFFDKFMWKGECQSLFVDLLPKSGCKDFFDNFLFLLVAWNQLQLSPDSQPCVHREVLHGKWWVQHGGYEGDWIKGGIRMNGGETSRGDRWQWNMWQMRMWCTCLSKYPRHTPVRWRSHLAVKCGAAVGCSFSND